MDFQDVVRQEYKLLTSGDDATQAFETGPGRPATFILDRIPECDGFYGASSMERLPTEIALTETTRRVVGMTRTRRNTL